MAFFYIWRYNMNRSYVTMEQHICEICGNIFETNNLLMDMHFQDTFDRYTVSDYGICNQCQSKIDEDYISLVEIDNEEYSESVKNKNANRTGRMLWLRENAAENLLNIKLETHIAFIDKEVYDYLETLHNNIGK